LPLVLVATFLAYVPTAWYPFVYDDKELILKNPRVQAWDYLAGYFSHGLWAHVPGDASPFYRPLFLLWMRVNYALFDTSAGAWHVANILVQVLVTALVYHLIRKLTRDQVVALIAAVIFGLHPVHMESVAWICGIPDPLMALGIIGSLLCYLHWQESSKTRFLTASVAIYLAALLVKEPAIVVLPIVFLLAWWQRHERKLSTTLIPFGLATALYLVARLLALPARVGTAPSSIAETFFTAPSIAIHYIKVLIAPFGLSAFYDSELIATPTFKNFGLPLIGVLLAITAVWALLRKLEPIPLKRSAHIALVLFVIPILLVLNPNNLVANDFIHDRYLYVSSIGFCLLLALAICRFVNRKTALIATSVIAISLGVLTLVQQRLWQDEITLYSDGLAHAPNNVGLRNNLGSALMANHRCEEAMPLLEQVVAKDPSNWKAYANMANCYGQQGDIDHAISYLERAASMNPDPVLARQLQWARSLPRQARVGGASPQN
jgi:protein O-mannosyl-transferase